VAVISSRLLRPAQSRKRVPSFAALPFMVICCYDLMTGEALVTAQPNDAEQMTRECLLPSV